MRSLYSAGASKLYSPRADVKSWYEIYKLIGRSIGLVDRMSVIKFPYRFALYPRFKIPTELSNFNMTYEECCNARAQSLLDLQDDLQLPIHLYYSGGIDSTVALVSFMKAMNLNMLKDRLVIALNQESITENPNFYEKHIRRNFRMVSSENISTAFNKTTIIVGGEHNDQLFGSDIIASLIKVLPIDTMFGPYDRKTIVNILKNIRQIDDTAAHSWFTILDDHIKQAPCEVPSVFHFFWWFNFVFKWQHVYFRILQRVVPYHRVNVHPGYLDRFYHHFFCTQEFQKWSMLHPELKIKKTWTSYKFHAKDLIYDYTGDEIYRDQKAKKGSLFRVFQSREKTAAITDQFEFLDTINKDEFYEPLNSFSVSPSEVRCS